MANELDQKTIPPAWSLRFSEYFSDLKKWVDESAYPALVQGPLKSESTITGIPAELHRLEAELVRSRPIPIALVGLTGVGKSTLLNAVLEQEFLPVGVIGSQTAAFVTISYAPEWEVTCEYIDEAELERIFQEAGQEIDEMNETGSPEVREKAEKKIRALLNLKDEDSLPSRDVLRAGPPSELCDIVSARRRRFRSDSPWKDQLNLHAKGKLWPITKTIDVRGPFEMLQSGVVISDLPGAGDLNRARAHQAAAAIKDAGQILIGTDARLLQTSLVDQLEGAGRLPHRLFMSNEKLQIVLVGTSLDKGLPSPEDDPAQVQELGLDPMNANECDVFEAVCSGWAKKILPQFAMWLRTKSLEFLPDVSESERDRRVDDILSRVLVVPTSAKDFVRHKRGRKMHVCRNPSATGLPRLRDLINALADHQIETTVSTLRQRIEAFRTSVFAALERSESAAGADIEGILAAVNRSKNQMQEVQDKQVQIVEDLRLAVLDRFQQIRETLGDKIDNAALKMRDMGRKQIQQHLADLHWASLRATVNHQGFWTTKNGRLVNLRDAMGGEITRLVPQAWSRLADDKIEKQIEGARAHVLADLKEYSENIRGIVDCELTDDMSRRTVNTLFEASLGRAEGRIEESAKTVKELLGKTSREMQERVDEAVDLSLTGVCADCSTDSGIGWRSRSVSRIIDGTDDVADDAKRRCMEIADAAFEALEKALIAFCQTAAGEMSYMGENIPSVLNDAIAHSRLVTPQAQKAVIANSLALAPPLPKTLFSDASQSIGT